MVKVVEKNSLSVRAISQPRFVELVGPAAAGKSTLARMLCQRNDKITIGTEISFRKVDQIPIFIRDTPQVLRSLFAREGGSRRWTWDEIKFLVYLDMWDRVLEQQANSHLRTILLDHGPIFKLATLHAFGPDWLRSESAHTWWRKQFQQWAAFLDLIVWLDAPDTLLKIRINERNQKHLVKGKTDQEVLQFLARYRSSYRYVLSGLATFNGSNVIQFDTSQESIDEIARAILAACDLELEADE
jgi:shikimate kinase